jgi:parallel beta-helix repeat protein
MKAFSGISLVATCLLAGGLLLLGTSSHRRPLPRAADAAQPGRCDRVAAAPARGRRDRRGATTVRRLIASLKAGQTGCLRGGVFVEDVTVSRSHITLRSYPGERATLRGRLWFPRGVRDDTVSDLHLDGRNRAQLPSPSVNGDAIRFLNDDVTNHNTNICFVLGSSYGRAHGTVIEGSRIHNCGHMPPRNTEHGIYVEDAVNTRIVGNVIFHNADRGIQLYPKARDTVIERNVIDGNGENVSFSGAEGATSSHNLVRFNVISNARVRADVESWYPRGTPPGVDNLVTDNCLFGGHGGPLSTAAGGFTAVGNVIADPQYAAPARGDYRVGAASPCAAVLQGR